MKRAVVIAAFVLPTFILVNYFEFYQWFYNNEAPAYLRGGVIQGDATDALQAFYEAARDACLQWRPNLVEDCQRYQVPLLGNATYVRPFSSAAGVLLTALSAHMDFMQALKFAIIALAMGGAILCGLLLLPFLAGLETRALAAIGFVWVGGWVATRPWHVADSSIQIVAFAVIVIALAAACLRPRGLPSIAMGSILQWPVWPEKQRAAKSGLQLLVIGLSFAVGYRIHLSFESKFVVMYLLFAIGLWPLLHRALPVSGSWFLSGLLTAVLYLSTTLVPFFYELSLVKQHQAMLVGLFLFIAIWRDDGRVFRALPLVLLFDMQNGARLCALIVIAEGLVGVFRRQMPKAIVPGVVTAAVGVTITAKTAFYPFDDRLYSISDAIDVFMTPAVTVAGLAALAVLWLAAGRKPSDTASPVALDRMLVYAASVVVMAGLQISTQGLFFDAFQLSTLFRSVAIAPVMAIFFVTFGLLFTTCRGGATDIDRRRAIAPIAVLLLLMSTAKGRNVSFSQLSEGVRASLSRHLPVDWQRRTPYMTLTDNTVYYDMDNLMTGALMQYSVIKILSLSRNPDFSRDKLTILPFGGRGR